eukprot:jgi/Botrbrau1/23573/Bobra.0141s0038.2
MSRDNVCLSFLRIVLLFETYSLLTAWYNMLQVDVNALCKASLVDPELMDLQEDELDDFLNFEAINISEIRSTTTMRKSM